MSVSRKSVIAIASAIAVGAAGWVAYTLHTAPLQELLSCVDGRPAGPWPSWVCEQGIRRFRLTVDEVRQLNQEAGVQYAVLLQNKSVAAEQLELFLQRGVRIDSVNVPTPGWTALHIAAGSGDVEAVRLLLAHGAQVDVRDRNGRTPLELARAIQENEPGRNLGGVIEFLERGGK